MSTQMNFLKRQFILPGHFCPKLDLKNPILENTCYVSLLGKVTATGLEPTITYFINEHSTMLLDVYKYHKPKNFLIVVMH